MKKKVKIGLDFDGVVAYNPFRIVRAPLSYFKRHILRIRKLKFWYPKAKWQQLFWIIIHESSFFPAKGTETLKDISKNESCEIHLITARYRFLDDHLFRWLKRHKLKDVFQTINLNKNDEQPHLFKEKLIKKLDLDFYVEDNLDIIKYLYQKTKNLPRRLASHRSGQAGKKQKTKTKIFWIYNLVDRWRDYPYKYPYLEKALEEIIRNSKLKVQNSNLQLKA